MSSADPIDLAAELRAASAAVTAAHLKHLHAIGALPALAELGRQGLAFGVVEAEPVAPDLYAPAPGRGVAHVVLPVIEQSELVDLVAWRTVAPQRWRRRTGRGWALEPDAIDWFDRAGGAPLRLHPDPLAWLRAGAHGAIVLDWASPKAERLRWHDELCCATDALAATLHRRLTLGVRLPDITLFPELPNAA